MKGRVADFIRAHGLLSSDGLHVVALSGGADSIAMLLTLHGFGYRIEAAHCNFHLRGDESDRDEDFVRKLCDSMSVPLHIAHFDTMTYASVHQVSVEMAARELRYGYFHQLCHDIGAETVCVAHHRDDAVETFLMNLLRGAGIHGLTGIRPRNGIIVRPLLCVSRQDIIDFLHSIGQDYVTDSTNLEDEALRNRIRHHVIPLLMELNPGAMENIDKTARYLREAEKIVDNHAGHMLQTLVAADSTRASQSVLIPSLLAQPSPELLLHEWLSPMGFNATQVRQIVSCLDGVPGREFRSSTHILVVDRNRLVVEPITQPMRPLVIPEAGIYRLPDDRRIEVKQTSSIFVSKSIYCATLDAAMVSFPLTLRTVREGDVFCPYGMRGRKLVSDYLTDRKLSILEKRRQLVVTDAKGAIIWLVGQRTDNRYRVSKQTTSVLCLKLSLPGASDT